MHQAAASTSTKMTRASHHPYGEQVTFYLMVGDDRHITIAHSYCCYYSNYRLQLPHFTWSGGFFFIVDDQLVKRETGGPIVRMYSCTPNPKLTKHGAHRGSYGSCRIFYCRYARFDPNRQQAPTTALRVVDLFSVPFVRCR